VITIRRVEPVPQLHFILPLQIPRPLFMIPHLGLSVRRDLLRRFTDASGCGFIWSIEK
jgi:hypothetical protein